MVLVLMMGVVAAVLVLAGPTWALSAAVNRDKFVDQETRTFPVAAAVTIYRGAFVGLHPVSGYLKPFEGGDLFAGIAYEDCNNASGAAGAANCRVQVTGDFKLPLTSVAIGDCGKAVYAVADDSLSLVGHPDGFVGRVVSKDSTNYAVVRLRAWGEKPSKDDIGSLNFVYDADGVAPTGIVAGNGPAGNWQAFSILGLGATQDSSGAAKLTFDAVAEVAQASLETPIALSVTKGMSLTVIGRLSDIGDNAALDSDIGFANVVDATTRANMDDGTLTRHARFHLDGASANINAESDDNVADVAAVDTTIDNDTAADKRLDILVRPSGAVEFWIDGVRMLSSTAFTVGSAAGVFAAVINLEKTADDTTAAALIKYARAAGARAA